LLTGKTPFDSKELLEAGLDAMRRTIQEQEPQRPSTKLSTMVEGELTTTAKRHHTDAPKLISDVRGDLDWIVMKCLEKDRARRYETANGLASDLQRHLDQEPVTACPPSNLYRFQKLVRRNKLAFAAAAAVTASLLIGLGISTWMFFQERAAKHEQARLRLQAQAKEKRAETEASKSRQVARFLEDMLQGVGPSVALGRDTTILREILDKAAQRVGKELNNQPEMLIELRTTLAATYFDLGLLNQAEEMAGKNLELARSSIGEENTAVADALGQLGEVRFWRSQLEEAEGLTREALRIRRKLLGSEHLDVAKSLRRLGNIVHRRQKPAEAETLFREALAIHRKLSGEEDLVVADLLHGLAVELRSGKLEEAEAISRQSLEIKRRLLGNEHPSVGESLETLGLCLKERGKLAEAETVFREALAMDEMLLGKDHFQAGTSRGGLGSVLAAQGRLAEAESLLRDAVTTQRKSLGEDTLDVTYPLFELGRVLERELKFAEAETSYRELLRIRKKLMVSPRGPMLAHLATVLRTQGKLSEAGAMLRDALRELQVCAETGAADEQNNLAWFLATYDDPGIRDGTSAVGFAEKAVAQTGRKNAMYLDTLAAAYAEAGEFTKAVSAQKEAIALLPDEGQKKDFTGRLTLYESNSPYREP